MNAPTVVLNKPLATAHRVRTRVDSSPAPIGQQRTDAQWVTDLSGQNGSESQQSAHEDLSAYLYVVVVNHLQRKYATATTFTTPNEADHALFAGDFVQDFMVKLMKDDYAILEKYRGTGRFTSWAAQITHNLVSSELRKAYWRREETAPYRHWQSMVCHEQESLEGIAIRHGVGETLTNCIEQLPLRYRTLIVRCILMGESAKDIAAEEQVTPNAIYIRLHRAKERLRQQAITAGLDDYAWS